MSEECKEGGGRKSIRLENKKKEEGRRKEEDEGEWELETTEATAHSFILRGTDSP